MRPLVPEALEIQRHSGSAWIGVIPFWMSGVTLRGWPAIPGLSRFPELNVRTYVALDGKLGVWFFSLDAANRLAVWTARRWFHLPYVYARMRVRHVDGRIAYESARRSGAGFVATYEPRSDPTHAAAGTLEHFLTERYCLFAHARSGALYRADIQHRPWALQAVEAVVARNDMLQVHGIGVPGAAPHRRYARRMDVVVWSPERVR